MDASPSVKASWSCKRRAARISSAVENFWILLVVFSSRALFRGGSGPFREAMNAGAEPSFGGEILEIYKSFFGKGWLCRLFLTTSK